MKRVLVVDDEPEQVEIMKDILDVVWDLPCDGFTDAEEAFEHLLNSPEDTYALAFLDSSVNENRLANGLYMSRAIRNSFKDLRLIRYSGSIRATPGTEDDYHGWYDKAHGNIEDIYCFLSEADFDLEEV